MQHIRNFFEPIGTDNLFRSTLVYQMFKVFGEQPFSPVKAIKITNLTKPANCNLLKKLNKIYLLKKTESGGKYIIIPQKIIDINVNQYTSPGSDLRKLISTYTQFSSFHNEIENATIQNKRVRNAFSGLTMNSMTHMFEVYASSHDIAKKEKILIKICGLCMQPELFEEQANTNRKGITDIIKNDNEFRNRVNAFKGEPEYAAMGGFLLEFLDHYNK